MLHVFYLLNIRFSWNNYFPKSQIKCCDNDYPLIEISSQKFLIQMTIEELEKKYLKLVSEENKHFKVV